MLLVAALAGCADEKARTDGFSFEAPAGWEDRTDDAQARTGEDFQGAYTGPNSMSLTIASAKPPDDAEPTLAAAAGVVRREILRRFEGEGSLPPDREIELDGVPARRMEGAAKGRAIAVVVAVRDGRSWNLTLSGPAEDFTAKPLDDAVSSWRWDR